MAGKGDGVSPAFVNPHSACSPVLPLTGSALFCRPEELQGPLSLVLQPVRGKISSPIPMSPGPAFVSYSRWFGEDTLMFSEPALLHLCQQGRFYCMVLQSVADGEEQGQFSLVLESVMGRYQLCASLCSLFPAITRATMDISTDLSCNKAVGPDMHAP